MVYNRTKRYNLVDPKVKSHPDVGQLLGGWAFAEFI